METSNNYLKSTFPVDFPWHTGFTAPANEYEKFLQHSLHPKSHDGAKATAVLDGPRNTCAEDDTRSSTATVTTSTDTGMATSFAKVAVVTDADKEQTSAPGRLGFMQALREHKSPVSGSLSNRMLTQNADLAYTSTTSPLIDLFTELEEVVTGPRLRDLLTAAWQADATMTLKIIFNSRSIHLGKSSRSVFYRCVGWLAHEHPVTLLLNLQWLNRPVIAKKVEHQPAAGPRSDDDDLVVVDDFRDENEVSRFDIKNGVTHGYFKDLLNILVLACNDGLTVLQHPRTILNPQNKSKKSDIVWDEDRAKKLRHVVRDSRHQTAVRKFEGDAFYRCLHITVARLFADQLRVDLKLLRSNKIAARRSISLCAKWAPTNKLFHDKHTFVVSSIAELLHPRSQFPESGQDRELYLRHAREAYRKDVSALRKTLEIVERDISAETFANIKYDRVPSLAMNQYVGLFAEKDGERFDQYVEQVALGKKRISGATLLPSRLISKARTESVRPTFGGRQVAGPKKRSKKTIVEAKLNELESKVADGQWKTLVQRIKDSGTLENVIAVCDVSGSMNSPTFPDGTCPMDSSIGMSLLIAEVAKPPFGGVFITFASNPSIVEVDLSQSLYDKIGAMEKASWGASTDFVAVFEKLILPLAREHNLKQDDMVKRIFVFSDMHFNQASYGSRWTSSFERIQKLYTLYGYELPELVFWNLAGGHGRHSGWDQPIAPKPVTVAEPGTALVSGYSQALLKVFLDGSSFEEEVSEEDLLEVKVADDEADADIALIERRKRAKLDPMQVVRKAISHTAYAMLTVYD